MTVFAVTNGAFDVDTFELAEIPLTTAQVVTVTNDRITLAVDDTLWEVQGVDFAPIGGGGLPATGVVEEVRKTSPTQSFVVFGGDPVPLENFLAAVETNATDVFLDSIFADDDVVIGGDEADVLSGRDGDDTVLGGAGDDELRGGPGDDRLFGADGADTLVGGAGDDLMDGGEGGDIFAFDSTEAEEGDDTVLGVDIVEDRIQLDADAIVAATTDVEIADDATPADLAAAMDESAFWMLGANPVGAALLTHPTGTVTLPDVAAADLPVATFAELFAAGVLVIEETAPPPAEMPEETSMVVDDAGMADVSTPEDGGVVA